jgi:cytochrome b subunit of formate dehydrogenase
MTVETIVFWASVVTIVVTGVALWSSRGVVGDSGSRRLSQVAAIALVVELILVAAAVLFYLSFNSRWRF